MNSLIIDTDPGKDDLFAIIYLILSKQFDIFALTTVAGNSTIQNVSNNARYILNLANATIPLYTGSSGPLVIKDKIGSVMGPSGLDGISNNSAQQLNNKAVGQIIKIVRSKPYQVTILAIGPLTNIAKAFQKDSKLPSLIKQLVIMGGSINPPGNYNRVAEFNFGFDPQAAKIVFASKVKKIMIPLDLCYKTPMNFRDFNNMSSSPLYPVFKDLLIPYQQLLKLNEGQNAIILYDLLAAYFLTNPADFTLKDFNIVIETKGEYTKGMSVTDQRSPQSSKSNTSVAIDLNLVNLKKNIINVFNTF